MSVNTGDFDKAYNQARKADKEVVEVSRGSFLGDMTEKHRKASGKEERLKAYRDEARRKVSLANKRVRRLEEQGLQNSPAYQALVKQGQVRFSVKGKDFNQLQSEVARLDRFINAGTSTVRGIVNHTKNLAEITKFKYDKVGELKQSIDLFFELSSTIEQYLRSVHDMASAIGYQKIWESINVYIEKNKVDLSDGKANIEQLITDISNAIVEEESPEHITSNPAEDGSTVDAWFKLLD